MSGINALVLAASILLIAQAAGAEVRIWTTHSLQNVLRDAQPPENAPNALNIEAARDEYEAGQICIRSTDPIQSLQAEPSDLEGPGGAAIPASAIRCRFVGYVRVEKNTQHTPPEELVAAAPGLFPDPLLEDSSIDVPANQTQPIWVTVHVPRSTAPGRYRGRILLRWRGGQASIPLNLTVWPFAIPQQRHLYVTNWFSPDGLTRRYGAKPGSERYFQILRRFLANMAAHRQNVALISLRYIDIARRGPNRYSFDFSRFDRLAEEYIRAGVADLLELGHVAHHKSGWSGPEFEFHNWSVFDAAQGKKISVPGREILPHLLPALVRHLKRRGWLSRAIIHIGDEPAVHNVQSWREHADFVHRYAPQLPRIDAIEAPDFGDSLEIWVPKLNHFYHWREAYERARQRGAELWFYTCCHPFGRFPNRFIDFPLIKTRILHWINWRYRLSGYLHWGLAAWTDDPFASAARGGLPPGDAWIIYPGREGPLDSIRWEAMRDGLEDYEYLWLLRQATERAIRTIGRPAKGLDPGIVADNLCATVLPGILTYTRDPSLLLEVRRRIAAEIQNLTSSTPVIAWTEPPPNRPPQMGPAVAVLCIVARPGTKLKVGDREVTVGPSGFWGANFSPAQFPVHIHVPSTDLTLTRSYAPLP